MRAIQRVQAGRACGNESALASSTFASIGKSSVSMAASDRVITDCRLICSPAPPAKNIIWLMSQLSEKAFRVEEQARELRQPADS